MKQLPSQVEQAMLKNVFFVLLLVFGFSYNVVSAEDNYQFDDENTRQSFLTLTTTLRCPKCQNQNIADSDAMIAHDMRRKVYQLLQEGDTEEEIILYMKTRYGDFVSYKPPVTPITSMLWLIPIFFIIIGALMFVVIKRNNNSSTQRNNGIAHEALERANSLLDEE